MKEDWAYRQLEDICDELFAGGDVPKNNFSKNITEDHFIPIYANGITDKGLYGFTNIFRVNKPSVTISARGTIGHVELREDNYFPVVRLIVLIPKPETIYVRFLYYSLLNIDFLNSGTSIPQLTVPMVKQNSIPVPPLPEQHQIVAILDKAFAAIDKAKANIEQNLQNAKELFQSRLDEVFTSTSNNWKVHKLGEVCRVERGSSPRPIKDYLTNNPDGVNWIKIGDVSETDKYVYTTKEKITKKGALKSRFVDIGDFILSNSMSYGRPYIMKIQGYIHDGWFVLRLPNSINPDYFWYLLVSPFIKRQFESLAAGAIVKNISSDLVKKAILPIPSFEQQVKIAEELELLNLKVNEVENKYLVQLSRLDELKKSILQKAFNGELT